MTDARDEFSTMEVDASGQPLDLGQVLPPEQVPMDDAAGGPDVADDDDAATGDTDTGKTIEETSAEDLSVQGGA